MNARFVPVLLFAAMAPATLNAFEPEHHWQITVTALTETKQRSNATGHLYEFDPDTAAEIADTTKLVDRRTLAGYVWSTSHFHCDEGLLEECMTSVKSALDDVVSLLAANEESFAALPVQASVARFRFGWAMHTLQDFYAHSSWLDVGHKMTVDLRSPKQFAGATAKNCYGGGNVSNPGIFSSGVYSATDDGDRAHALDGLCIHGPYCTIPRLVPGITDCSGTLVEGLGKDRASNSLRPKAVLLALRSTSEAAYYVIQSLERQRKFRAICAFVGESILNCMKRQKVTVPDVEFTAFAWDGQFDSLEDTQPVTFQQFNPRLGRLLYIEKKFTFILHGSGNCQNSIIVYLPDTRGCFFGISLFGVNIPEDGPFEYILCTSVGDLGSNCGGHNPEPKPRTIYRANANGMSVAVPAELVLTETLTTRNRSYYIQAEGASGSKTGRIHVISNVWFGAGVEDERGPWPAYSSHGTFSGGVTMKTEMNYVYSPAP